MDVKTNAQRFLIVLLTILSLFSAGSFYREVTFSKFNFYLSDKSALISFNKNLYVNIRPDAEFIQSGKEYSLLFADKKQTSSKTTAFDYFIFSKILTQEITNGADTRTIELQHTSPNTVRVNYNFKLRREPALGSQYYIHLDLPQILNFEENGDYVKIINDCELKIYKEPAQAYLIKKEDYLLRISKVASKEFTMEINFEINCTK